jgi:drug/metabolite transporter (DMT)-like permease
MLWLPLTLLCAFSLATADATTKKYLADYDDRELTLVRFGFTGLFLAPFLFVIPLPHLPAPFWGWLLGLVPPEILAMLLYMRAIRNSPLSITLPYLAFTPVFTVVTGFLLLGEKISLIGFTGILLVVGGAYLLNFEQALAHPRRVLLAPFQAILREQGSRLMLVVALIYSATSVMGKGALQYVSPSFFGAFYFTLLGIITIAIFSVQRPQIVRVMWRRPVPHAVVGLMMAVMAVTHFLAIKEIEVSYMIAVKRTSLLFGILYGALLFSERHLIQHLAAGTLMVGGVILIAI